MRLAQRVSSIQPSATLSINAKAKALKAQGQQIISFGVGEPDFPTPHHIQQMAIQAIYRNQSRYTAVGGIDELKTAVADTIEADYGLRYTPEQVIVSCGGKQVLYNLMQVLLEPGDEAVIPAPYWVSYPDLVTLAGATPVAVPCREQDGFKLTAERLESALTESSRMLILNSPCNPTGAHYSREELSRLAEVLRARQDLIIVSDDIYYRILFGGEPWCNLAMLDPQLRKRTVIVNGLSKTYAMTGWRIGYGLGDPAIIRAAVKIQSQSTSNPCSISQWAGVAALRGDQSEVKIMVASFEQRCRFVLDSLRSIPGVTCPQPAGAFYVFPNVSHYYGKQAQGYAVDSSLEMAEYLMEQAHIAVVPGGAFGEDRCIRLSYALAMVEIKEGLSRLAQALQELR